MAKTIDTIDDWFAPTIEEVAAKAGLRVRVENPRLVICGFDMGEGRMQDVWIRPVGTDAGGNVLCRLSSPALRLESGALLGQRAASGLLRENGQLAQGSWAIECADQCDFLVATETQILLTMQPEEFQGIVLALATAADALEQRLGKDFF
ncbi:hypothetical protein JXA47_10355 [Candidatus Sumerlaeota bacterium]|nr:hypothetical protein [Candidatus Sumerlaeota bacterium]